MLKHKIAAFCTVWAVVLVSSVACMAPAAYALRAPAGAGGTPNPPAPVANAVHQCGSGHEKTVTAINFGCKGEACVRGGPGGAYCNGDHSAIVDMLFAIIRFLTNGVGLIVVGSLVWAGIQYTAAKGDPQAAAAAIKRVHSSVIALLMFVFAYALLNYVIPAGFFG